MAVDSLEIRLSLQKLLLSLVVVIVPLSLVGLYITSESVSSQEESNGTQLRAIAQATSRGVAQYIDNLVTEVGSVALAPAILEAVSGANRSYQNLGEVAIHDRIDAQESKWGKQGADPMIKSILTSQAAGYLRAYREVDARLMRIWVTDEIGAIVAATDKPEHYFQGGQDYWQAVYAQGRGRSNVTSGLFDDRSNASYISIGMPIFDQSSGQVLGVVNAWVNASGLSSLLTTASFDRNPILLIGGDGIAIAGLGAQPSNKLKSEEYTAVREAIAMNRVRQSGHVVASTSRGKRLIGFADTGLEQMYPNLGWMVLVSMDQRDATAPIRPVLRFAFLMVVLSLLMLTLLAVYLFLHRRQQVAEIEVLKTPQPPKSMSASA